MGNPTMTAIADNKKRVTIKTAKPGDRFDVQVSPDGTVILKVPKDDEDVPVVKMVRTKEGFLMFPKGRGHGREAILSAIREDRDVYQSGDRSMRSVRRGRFYE